MERKIFKIELEKQIEVLEILNKQLDSILGNNPWEIHNGKIVFKDWGVHKLYKDTIKLYIMYSNTLGELEQLCRDKRYLDVLRDMALLKLEKGII